MTGIHRPYSPITLLAANDPSRKGAVELRGLSRIWARNRQRLLDSDVVRKLRVEWAIETGLVEDLYRFDRGVTITLINEGISVATLARSARIDEDEAADAVALMEAQLDVAEGLFAFIKGDEPLTEAYIRHLHAELTAPQQYTTARRPDGTPAQVQLEHGRYKTQPNNVVTPSGVIHDYCPPGEVAQQMEKLIEWHRELEAEGDAVHPEVHAAWLHHRFTQIHPFADGNGRVARALGSLVLLRRGLLPMMIRADGRSPYLAALEAADDGDLLPLVQLVGLRQKEDILMVLSADEPLDSSSALEAAVQGLRQHDAYITTQALSRTHLFEVVAKDFFERRCKEVNRRLAAVTPIGRRYEASTQFIDPEHPSAHLHDVRASLVAQQFSYTPDFGHLSAYQRFWITTDEHTELVVHIHALAGRDLGVRPCLAFAVLGSPTKLPEDTYLATTTDSPFEFNIEDDDAAVESQFRRWLKRVYNQWLNLWASLQGPATSPTPNDDPET